MLHGRLSGMFWSKETLTTSRVSLKSEGMRDYDMVQKTIAESCLGQTLMLLPLTASRLVMARCAPKTTAYLTVQAS